MAATCLLRDASVAHMPDEWHVNLYGTTQGATLAPFMLYGESAESVLTNTQPLVAKNPAGMHVAAYRHFFACIREGRETESPPERSVVVMQILDAIYRSAAEGGTMQRF